jgi:hypothetical protein
MNDPQQADHPVLSGFQSLRQYFRRGRSGEESRMQSSQLTQTSSSSSGLLPLRGCPETKALKNKILCHVLGKTKNGITGSAVSCHAFSKV